jgi:hypothetical protein
MNFATLSPVDYTINQPQLTPMSKRMADVLTLADMMDKAKINKMAIADAERKQKTQEAQRQEALKAQAAFETVPQVPEVAPISTGGMYQSIKPIAPPMEAPAIGFSAAPQPAPAPLLNIPSVQDPQEQRLAQIPGQVLQAQIEAQQPQIQAAEQAKALQAPEARIPKGHQWKTPDEYSYYIKLKTLDPDAAQEYEKGLVEQKYKLAQTETADVKAKDLKDYQVGSILNTAWKKGQSPEDDAALVQGLIGMGYDAVEARSAVDNAPALVAKYQSSPAMLGLGKLEAGRKATEAKFEFDQKNEAFKQTLALRKDAREAAADARAERKLNAVENEKETKKREKVTSVEADLTKKRADALAMYEELSNNPKATGALQNAYAELWSSNEAADRRRNLNKIKNGLGFGSLVDFRKQGITFGALSEREYDRAAAAATKLSFDASVKNNLEALQEYIDGLDASLANLPDKGEYRPAIKSGTKAPLDLGKFLK